MSDSSSTRALLAQSDLLLLLADAFRPPPQATQSLAALAYGDVAELVPVALGRSEVALMEAFGALRAAARDVPPAEASAEYYRLFAGSVLCPLNETAHVRRDKGAILGDLCGFYRAFGWQPAAGTGEKPDHLVCELEFVALLLVMRAAAEQQHRAEAREVSRTALHRFVEAHLSDWLPAVAARLSACAATVYYRGLAAALAALWAGLTAAHGWCGTPPALALPVVEPESPYDCIVPGRPAPDHAEWSAPDDSA